MKKFDSPQSSNNDSAGVQSAEVGLRLLYPLIEADGPLSLKAISDAAQFAPPKAHRYLVSFVRAGLVERAAESGCYKLGPLAMKLGFAALRQIDQDRLGREAVLQLANELGVTAALVIWTEAGPVIIAAEPAMVVGSVFLSVRVGSRLPITRSASGLVFLSFMNPSERSSILAAAVADERSSIKEVSARLEIVRSRGFAKVVDNVLTGMSGLAVPVFGANGHVRFALAAVGPTTQFKEIGEGHMTTAFKRVASDLSRKFSAADH